MPRLFTVRWPRLARLEAVALFPVILVLAVKAASPVYDRFATAIGPYAAPSHLATDHLFWVMLAAMLLVPYLALMVLVDRLLRVRKGLALLSILATAIWTGTAALLLEKPVAVLIAGMAAFLLHIRPLWIGLIDRGFVGTRLSAQSDAAITWRRPSQGAHPWVAPNPRGVTPEEARDSPGRTLLHALIWCAALFIIVVGYTYRHDLASVGGQVLDELLPGRTVSAGAKEAISVRGSDGHFAFNAIANGVPMSMLFDTGASFVALRAEDAARLGFTGGGLTFSMIIRTANGLAEVAPVTIDTLTIGNVTQRSVRAVVARRGAMDQNLLGQSFLTRLASFGVEKNRLILRGY